MMSFKCHIQSNLKQYEKQPKEKKQVMNDFVPAQQIQSAGLYSTFMLS